MGDEEEVTILGVTMTRRARDISVRIYRLCRREGIHTFDEAAERVGMDRTEFKDTWMGDIAWKPATLEKVADAFGVPACWLETGESPEDESAASTE